MRLAGFATSIQKICTGSRGRSSTRYRHGVVRPGGPSSSSCCRRELARNGPNFSRSRSSSLQHAALELWPPVRLSSVADATHQRHGYLAGVAHSRLSAAPAALAAPRQKSIGTKLAGKLGTGLETLDSESGSWNNPSINNRSHGGTVPASAERPDSEGRTG